MLGEVGTEPVAPHNERVSFGSVKEATRKSMRSNTATGTSPELRLRKALWAAGLRGYRKNVRDVTGRPDLVFGSRRLAVFIHGCFWHRCERCSHYRLPKTNTAFWRRKAEANVERHSFVCGQLVARGWRVMTLWECEIKEDVATCVARIADALCLEMDSRQSRE